MTPIATIRRRRDRRALLALQQACLWLLIGCACAATAIILVVVIPRRVPVFNLPAPDLPTTTVSRPPLPPSTPNALATPNPPSFASCANDPP
jgi:hypothetical protein